MLLEVQTSKMTIRLTETPAVTTAMHEDFATTNTELQIQCSHSLIDPVPVVIINEETQFIRKFCCVQVMHMTVSLQAVIYYLPVSLLCIISSVGKIDI